MTDELNAPLGNGLPSRKSFRDVAPRGLFVAALGAVMAAGTLALYLAPRDLYPGEPYAVARIEPAKPPEPAALTPPVAAAEPAGPSASREQIDEAAEFEQLSGVRVTRRNASEGGTARIIRIEPASGVRLTAAPDRRIVEKGRYGLLPRIGVDGARAMDVYARPFVSSPALKVDAPRIALVIGGLGLNAQTFAEAIDQLPDGVTFAFAPYGADLERLVALGRARGHEALLQAPMEPFDYPHNNPGPHTLVTGAADGGLDDLHWLMSRFTGYAGVMNYLGGRYTADERALSGALAEIAQRGLFFLDDGAPQSLTATLAPRYSLPHARVDVTLDARPTPQSIDAALAQLETQAREKGAAIGFVNAAPATITRLARFARDLERRGIALAPVSAVLAPRAGGGAAADAARGPRR